MAGTNEIGANPIAAAVEPHQRIVQGFAGFTVEDEDRFALVRQAEEADGMAMLFHHLPEDGERVLPDFVRVVFDPAGLRVELAVLAAGPGEDFALRRKDERFGCGGALVKG